MDSGRLEFRTFSHGRGGDGAPGFFASDPSHAPPPDPGLISGNLLDTSSGLTSDQPRSAAKPHFLSLSFYQRFFDIDEDQVFSRLLNSAIPRRRGNFIADFVQPNPDLWGPFWVCVTLVFSIAIVGNFARFLQTYSLAGGFDSADVTFDYTSDFTYVTGATSLVFGYLLTLPSLIYAYLWYQRPVGLQYSFFDLLCAYGYALSAFIPVTVLWLIFPFYWLRWSFLMCTVVLTGSVLTLAIWPAVKEDPNRLAAFGFLLVIFLAHVLLALCLKEFFLDEAIPPTFAHHGSVPIKPPPSVAPPAPIPTKNISAFTNNGTLPG